MKSEKSITTSSAAKKPMQTEGKGLKSAPDFSRVAALMESAIEERAFPGGAIAVTQHQRLILSRAFGRFTYAQDAPAVTPETRFDLASLTKVMATTSMAMLLHERGLLDMDQPLEKLLPEFVIANTDNHNIAKDTRRETVTIRMLLAHSSGLPAHRRFHELTTDREHALKLALHTPLETPPMTKTEYSDIGFIVLGVALERIAGEALEAFCSREIFHPLGMTYTQFRPAASLQPLIPPTVDDRIFRRRVIQGEVHDENASVLGGAAGHAGLFGPAGDVAKFADCMLRGGSPIMKTETARLFTRRQTPPKGASRALGWDTPSAPSQSGKHFSERSFGHLGYTGTSLWIDPDRELSVTLLTNRTWPDATSQAIKQVRPALHDAIIEAID